MEYSLLLLLLPIVPATKSLFGHSEAPTNHSLNLLNCHSNLNVRPSVMVVENDSPRKFEYSISHLWSNLVHARAQKQNENTWRFELWIFSLSSPVWPIWSFYQKTVGCSSCPINNNNKIPTRHAEEKNSCQMCVWTRALVWRIGHLSNLFHSNWIPFFLLPVVMSAFRDRQWRLADESSNRLYK